MTDFNPPLKDMLFAINHLSGMYRVLQIELFADFDQETEVCFGSLEPDQYSG